MEEVKQRKLANLKTAYKLNGKTLNYLDIYKNMPEKLKNSLKRMYSKINLDAIKNIIYSTPTLNDEMKEFYYKTIEIRKNEIIDKYYKEINI